MADDLKNKLATKAQGGALATQSDKPKTIFDMIKAMTPEIQRALPKHLDADRLARIAITAIRNNSKLQACSAPSFLGSLMQSAQLGLEPNTPLGQAYLIPYNTKNGMECQFQLGYKGLIDLCRRSGEFKSIYAHEVYENDEFHFEYGLNKALTHIPQMKDRGKVVTAYYAVYHLKDGGYDFIVMSGQDVQAHRMKYSKASSSGPWVTDFDAMAKKTLLKQLLKYAPISIEVQRNLSQDETFKHQLDKDMADVPSVEIDVVDITPDEPEVVLICKGCATSITQEVHDKSMTEFNTPLCGECQKASRG